MIKGIIHWSTHELRVMALITVVANVNKALTITPQFTLIFFIILFCFCGDGNISRLLVNKDSHSRVTSHAPPLDVQVFTSFASVA